MSLKQLLEVLSRQRGLFIVVLVAMLGAAVAYTLSVPKAYSTTATLFVGENRPISTGANAVQLDEVLARSYAELLDTATVRGKVVRALPFRTTQKDIDEKVGFEVLTGTRLIEIGAEDASPGRATQIANTYADTFVAHQRSSTGRASRQRLDDLNRRIRELVLEIRELEAEAGGPAAAALERARTELSAARDTYRVTEQNLALQDANVSVSTRADVPSTPAKPRKKLMIAIAAIIALALALTAALLRDTFDKRVRDEHELTDLLGVPVISRVPIRRRGATRERAVSEAFELLRTNLLLSDTGHARVLAVTSALPGDGKTTVLQGLSQALALAGESVVAVDCDLRRPMLASYFESDASEGVTNVLISAREPEEVMRPTQVPGVRVIGSGPQPPNPSALLARTQLDGLFATLRHEAGYVLVDTPPVAAGAETSTIASAVDGVILVVDLRASRRDALAAAREQLMRSGANLVGIVLNRTPASGLGYSYYYGRETRRTGGLSRKGAAEELPEAVPPEHTRG